MAEWPLAVSWRFASLCPALLPSFQLSGGLCVCVRVACVVCMVCVPWISLYLTWKLPKATHTELGGAGQMVHLCAVPDRSQLMPLSE